MPSVSSLAWFERELGAKILGIPQPLLMFRIEIVFTYPVLKKVIVKLTIRIYNMVFMYQLFLV